MATVKTKSKAVKKPVAKKAVVKKPFVNKAQKLFLAKKEVEAHNRKVARDNAAFAKMSKSEKRVAIARDVIAQLDVKKLVAQSGTWLTSGGDDDFIPTYSGDDELQKVFSKVESCTGCALGGMFLCAVQKADNLKIKNLSAYNEEQDYNIPVEGTDLMKYLKKFFDNDQLELIENHFENGMGSIGVHIPKHKLFAPDVTEDEMRMRLIMQNIIVNKGTFKPEVQPLTIIPGYVG